MTSNVFPQDILSSIFNIADNSNLVQHFQEIIDTVNIGVKTMADENPDFVPLNKEVHIPHQIINASGLRELKSI